MDTDSHPASVNGNAFLIKSGIVNQNGFLPGIVEKSSGSFTDHFFRGNVLQFNAGGNFVGSLPAHMTGKGEKTDLPLPGNGLVNFSSAMKSYGVAFHTHNADGGAGLAALGGPVEGFFFNVDFDFPFKIGSALNEKRVTGSEL